MAENRSVVADAGPLIGLARIGSLDLIRSVFTEILIPTAVAAECCRDLDLPGARKIHHAIAEKQLQVVELPKDVGMVFPPALGDGERSVVELAANLRIGALIFDEQGSQTRVDESTKRRAQTAANCSSSCCRRWRSA